MLPCPHPNCSKSCQGRPRIPIIRRYVTAAHALNNSYDTGALKITLTLWSATTEAQPAGVKATGLDTGHIIHSNMIPLAPTLLQVNTHVFNNQLPTTQRM